MKLLAIVFLTVFSMATYAQSGAYGGPHGGGHVTSHDGHDVEVVTEGNGDRDLAQRVQKLERTVRQLQDRVFELENDPTPTPVPVPTTPPVVGRKCTIFVYGIPFIGEGRDDTEALKLATLSCRIRFNESLCHTSYVCENKYN